MSGIFEINGDYRSNPSSAGSYECMSRLLASAAYLVTYVAEVEEARFSFEIHNSDFFDLSLRDRASYQCVHIYVGLCNLLDFHGTGKPVRVEVDSECGYTFANARVFLVDFARLVVDFLNRYEDGGLAILSNDSVYVTRFDGDY